MGLNMDGGSRTTAQSLVAGSGKLKTGGGGSHGEPGGGGTGEISKQAADSHTWKT